MIIEFLWHPKTALALALLVAGVLWAYRTAMDDWAAEALTGPKREAAEDLLRSFGLSMYRWNPADAAPCQLRFGVRSPEDVSRLASTGMRPWPFYRALCRMADDPSGWEAEKLRIRCELIERKHARVQKARRRIG